MKEYKPVLVWVLVVAGLLWGYQGLMGSDLLTSVLGESVTNIVQIVVGVVALLVGYLKLTAKK